MTQTSFAGVKVIPFGTIPWHSKISIDINIDSLELKSCLIFIVQIGPAPVTGIAIKHLFCQLYDIGRLRPYATSKQQIFLVQNHVGNHREKEKITLKISFLAYLY